MTGFYMKCDTRVKWVNEESSPLNAISNGRSAKDQLLH